MKLDLPSTPGTDGVMLMEQSQHAIILDMITRVGGVWPRYGTYPGVHIHTPKFSTDSYSTSRQATTNQTMGKKKY